MPYISGLRVKHFVWCILAEYILDDFDIQGRVEECMLCTSSGLDLMPACVYVGICWHAQWRADGNYAYFIIA